MVISISCHDALQQQLANAGSCASFGEPYHELTAIALVRNPVERLQHDYFRAGGVNFLRKVRPPPETALPNASKREP